MRFENVCLESLGYCLPAEVWSSGEIENRLEPLYERLKLPAGRLELMTGIRERRFWAPGTRPSVLSVKSCRKALEAADWDPQSVGMLIHGSVCRDFLEPATACTVHHQTGLPADCVIYDVSNACLGLLNGILQAAAAIELRQISAALVVGSEGGRNLVETTIHSLLTDPQWNRQSIKEAVASLTIGSASCAVLLTHAERSRSGNRIVGGAVRAHTEWNHLCQSDHDQAGANFQPLMSTDSTQLLQQGVATGQATFEKFLQVMNWDRRDIQATVCHQVGVAHRKLMLDSLQLPVDQDFVSFPWLGNTGAAALPVTLASAAEQGFLKPGQQVALLGIGSGINSIMLGCEWRKNCVAGEIHG